VFSYSILAFFSWLQFIAMNILFVYLIAAFARVAVCQPVLTIWVATVTVPASSPSAAASMVPQAVNNEIQTSETQQISSPTTRDATISTSESSSSHESAVAHEATSSQALPQVTALPNNDNDYYEPEVSSSSGIDTEGGASGSGASAFSLSTGGLAAILIVVILVALFGSKYLRPTYLVLH
jgi:cobalamin biosynthesis Mg chelatase CobN